MTIKDILKIVEKLEESNKEVRPIVERGIKILLSYGPELRNVFDAVGDYTVERRLRSLKLFQEGGCTREEAIYMTMDEWWATKRALLNNKATYKSST